MPINIQTVAHTASLAKLEIGYGLPEAEAKAALEKMTAELADIVHYIDILAEADTEGVLPLYSVIEEAPGPREDIPRAADCEAILALSPDRIADFFAVPKIL